MPGTFRTRGRRPSGEHRRHPPPRGPSGPLYGRLRIVGPDAAWFQNDLDRTNPSTSAEALKKSTYLELVRYNCEYAGRRGNPFPLCVLAEVADNYHIIQQEEIKRCMMKKLILAALSSTPASPRASRGAARMPPNCSSSQLVASPAATTTSGQSTKTGDSRSTSTAAASSLISPQPSPRSTFYPKITTPSALRWWI